MRMKLLAPRGEYVKVRFLDSLHGALVNAWDCVRGTRDGCSRARCRQLVFWSSGDSYTQGISPEVFGGRC